MLPGTRYAHSLYADQHEMEVFITPGMLACLKEHGMEICGKGFTATKVWYGDGKDNVDGCLPSGGMAASWVIRRR